MNNEYKDNLKKQNTVFKKFKKAMRGITVGVATGLAGLMLPSLASQLLPSAIYGSVIMTSILPITSIALMAFGAIKGVYSAIKSTKLNGELNDLKCEASELVDALELEKEKLKVKVKEYEKEKVKENVNTESKTISYNRELAYDNKISNQKGRVK